MYRLAKNTVYNISAYAVSAIVSFFTLPLMLRAYGQSVYGVFLLASSVVGIVALFDFGLTTVLTKEIAQLDESDSHVQLSRLMRLSLWWFIALGIVAALAVFLISRIPWMFQSLTPVELKLLQDMLLIHALAQLVLWPTKVGTILLAGEQRFDAISLGNLATAILSGLIIIGVLMAGRGPLWITGLTAIVTALISSLLVVYARVPRKAKRIDTSDRDALPSLGKRLIRVSMPIFIAQVAAFIVLQQTDRFIIGVFVSVAAVTLYEIASKFSFFMVQASSLLVSALPPFVAKLDTKSTQEEMATFFIRSVRYLSLLMVPLHILLIVLAPDIIRFWVGEGYEQSALMMRILLGASLFVPLYLTADSIIVARDRYHVWAPFSILTALINLVLSIILVLLFGVLGVAISTLISYMVETILYVMVTSREIGYSIRIWFLDVVASSLFPGVVAGIVVWAFCHYLPPDTLWALGGYLGIGIITAAFCVFFFVLSQQERDRAQHVLSGIVRQ